MNAEEFTVTCIGEILGAEAESEKTPHWDMKTTAKLLRVVLEPFDLLTTLLILRALFGIEPEDLLGRAR